MKIVKINGGLGNQMFQYAFALSLAARGADAVFIDPRSMAMDRAHNGYELDRVFRTTLPEAAARDVARLSVPPTTFFNRVRRKYFTKRTHLIDRKFGYQPELLDLAGDRYYDGYWQSERYFADIAGDVRRELSFKEPLDSKNMALLDELPKPVASVHVRRGDYVGHASLDVCTPEYYERAVAAVRDSGAASFLVLSDNIEYCRSSLRIGGLPVAFVDWNVGENAWQDMALMSRCALHVIANSSFSWWGAWLDPNPGKIVVAPAVWNRRQRMRAGGYYRYTFDDVLPEGWRRVVV